VPIDRNSYELIQLMRDTAERWEAQRDLLIARQRLAGASSAETAPRIAAFTIDVSFDAIADRVERDDFLNLPTTFTLPPEMIDRLRAIAGRLLRESPDYQRFLEDLRRP
jgi:NTE family protein